MSEVLDEMLRRDAVLSSGLGFMATGWLLARLPRLLNAQFVLRDRHAARLREAGRGADAARLQRRSVLIRRQLAGFGRVLMGLGLAAAISSLFLYP